MSGPERIWAHMQCGTWSDQPEDDTEDQIYIRADACLHGEALKEVRAEIHAVLSEAENTGDLDAIKDIARAALAKIERAE